MNDLSKNSYIHMRYLLLLWVFLPTLTFAQSKSPYQTLVWSDEFNYQGLPDPKKWNYEEGFVRNKEPQYYTKERLQNIRVENGTLIIEARKESYPLQKSGSANAQRAGQSVAGYTSASIMTLGKKTWKYGRFEVRAKVPKGKGSWPAFWMKGANNPTVKWPFCGEIDVMEYAGKDSTQVYGTVHYADSTDQYRYEGKKPSVGAPYEDFHIYAAEWYEDRIEFYYDDLKYFVFDLAKAQKGSENPFQKDFYLMLNLALGRQGTMAGPLYDEILPLTYVVDYVRVYQ
ncbi:beta-glucanase (GH16 family) [Siphonobacter sp. SORGH_AS 1065]|nr:beta-glucanase (GH16 family) [Siphonobacter sp. SORGH_AS_1065]